MPKPTKIAFHFEKNDDYRIIPVNGVWGGPTVRGDIMADFFHESLSLPKEIIQAVLPGGRLGEEIDRKPQNKLQRTVLVGMVLTAEQADSIGRWLQEKAREVRERTLEKEIGEGDRNILTTH